MILQFRNSAHPELPDPTGTGTAAPATRGDAAAPSGGDWLPSLPAVTAKTAQRPERDLPCCGSCGTDEFLIFEDFLPQAVLPDGGQQPASVGYTCSRCEQFGGQNVPSSWTPPGWFWYS